MFTRKTANRIVLAVCVVALLVLVPAAMAAKGGGRGGGGGNAGTTSSSLGLVLLDSADGQAHHGQRVSFEVSTTATDRPFVGLRCWQGANWVYDGYVGFFPTYIGDPWLTLANMYWDPALDASCTARLFYYDKRANQKVLATLDFPVAP